MKTLRLLGMALFAVLMCVNFASCGNNDEEITMGKEELCTVSINLSGIVETTEVPLGRSSTSKTLYCLFIEDVAETYAYGLFEETTNISVDLVKGKDYAIYCFAIKDATTKIYKDENGTYGYPFNSKITNEFIYDSNQPANPLRLKLADGNEYAIANVEEYSNNENLGYQSYTASVSENIDVHLERYKAFGVNFSVEGLTEGKLELTISKTIDETTYTSPIITIDDLTKPIEEIFTISGNLRNYLTSTKDFEATLNVKWFEDEDSEGEILGTPTISFKQDVKTIINFKEDTTPQVGLTISVSDAALPNGTTYNVEGNTVEEAK